MESEGPPTPFPHTSFCFSINFDGDSVADLDLDDINTAL